MAPSSTASTAWGYDLLALGREREFGRAARRVSFVLAALASSVLFALLHLEPVRLPALLSWPSPYAPSSSGRGASCPLRRPRDVQLLRHLAHSPERARLLRDAH